MKGNEGDSWDTYDCCAPLPLLLSARPSPGRYLPTQPSGPVLRPPGWDAVPADAAGLRAGKRSAVLRVAARHQCRVQSESRDLPMAYPLTAYSLPLRFRVSVAAARAGAFSVVWIPATVGVLVLV